MMGIRVFISALVSLFGSFLQAQEHPYLSRFQLTEGDGFVRLDWTMVGGNTCDGTRILRSLDGLQFDQIGELSGLCGSISQATNFRYVDDSPPELRTTYYRLELGTNGSSSIQRIDLERLFSVDHRVFPSPMSENGILLLRVDPEARVGVRVWSASGRLVYDITGRGGRLDLPAATWPAGVYLYEAVIEGKRLAGRFVVL